MRSRIWYGTIPPARKCKQVCSAPAALGLNERGSAGNRQAPCSTSKIYWMKTKMEVGPAQRRDGGGFNTLEQLGLYMNHPLWQTINNLDDTRSALPNAATPTSRCNRTHVSPTVCMDLCCMIPLKTMADLSSSLGQRCPRPPLTFCFCSFVVKQ